MVCVYCSSKTEIINTRHQSRTNSTWRRRKCLRCGALITSIEQADYAKLWVISDNKGKLKPFKRDKLFVSIFNSLRHRNTALSDCEGLTATVISKLSKLPTKGQIGKEEIVNTTLTCLKHFDKAAAVQYKAYHTS